MSTVIDGTVGVTTPTTGGLILQGSTSGTCTVNASAISGTTVITMPTTSGIVPTQDATTGAITLPVGTTAERPASPVAGMQRINTTTGYLEVYNGGAWYNVSPVLFTPTVEYLVVAGGGGGGGGVGSATYASSGGGAGGYRTATGLAVASGVALTVTVGAGGAYGTKGLDSVFSSITSTGGGCGYPIITGGATAVNGGSGGGGGDGVGLGGFTTGGTGTAGQGFAGGNSSGSQGQTAGGGGAGGAGVGTGAGGVGLSSSISGSSVFYAGGGGGGNSGATAGGNGGGGTGGLYTSATAGTANTGGGGGGCQAATGALQTGKSGGSGIVIIRYADTYNAATSTTGSPTITVAGGYRVYKWTASGSITF